MHPGFRITNRHRSGRISVVAAAEGQELTPAAVTAGKLVLDGHLHGYLYADGTGVGQEDLRVFQRNDLRQSFAQRDGRGVGKPAEHDVAHPPELVGGRGVQLRDVVAVNSAPPGAHAVDHLAPVRQGKDAAGGPLDRVDGQRVGQRGVRMPEVGPVEG